MRSYLAIRHRAPSPAQVHGAVCANFMLGVRGSNILVETTQRRPDDVIDELDWRLVEGRQPAGSGLARGSLHTKHGTVDAADYSCGQVQHTKVRAQ